MMPAYQSRPHRDANLKIANHSARPLRDFQNSHLASNGTCAALASRRGVSLIEVIVYVAIFAVLSALTVNILLSISQALTAIRVTRAFNGTAAVAMERMIREIRQARDIVEGESTLGASPGVLTLDTYVDPGGNTKIKRKFSISGGALTLQEGSNPSIPFTAGVTIANLTFWSTGAPSSQAVRVELALTAGSGKYMKQQTFYGTAVLRGSY